MKNQGGTGVCDDDGIEEDCIHGVTGPLVHLDSIKRN